MYSIETKDLRHGFVNEKILLKGLNMKVPKGSIYGFVGKNGAGKTTTIKLLLGLLKIQEGEILVLGERLKENRISILSRIGSLVESPSFYAHLSAKDNLRVLQKIYQCPESRIEDVLELMELSSTGNKKVRQFSLGMKQRLSIAIALLHEPELLILDEPTNGLDPDGIIKIRELLRKINSTYGTTIIISSHLLAELEKLVSHLAIIHDGLFVFQGSLADLKRKQQEVSRVKITSNNPQKTMKVILESGWEGVIEDDTAKIKSLPLDKLAGLIKRLVENDIEIYQVVNEALDLESMFINLTTKSIADEILQ